MICRARFVDFDAATLYALLRLRVDVFVVEQRCAYPELDGRDTEAGTVHLWTADDGGPTAYLRLLADPGGTARIGRVCTRVDVRGTGLAGRLLTEALDEAGPRAVVLDAQAPVAGWYVRHGFRISGAEFVEDGIAHLPMRRDPGDRPAGC